MWRREPGGGPGFCLTEPYEHGRLTSRHLEQVGRCLSPVDAPMSARVSRGARAGLRTLDLLAVPSTSVSERTLT